MATRTRSSGWAKVWTAAALVVAMIAGLLGAFERVASAAVPGAPTIGTATAGNASATVSWTAPVSDGGSPITGYVVTPYIGFAPQASTTFVSVVTTQTVTGLTNGTTYRFRVQAINADGTGGFSTASNPVTPVAPTVPGAPTIGSAMASNASALVSWTAPVSDGGSPITGYVVTPYIGFAPQASTTFVSVATTQTVTGLTNGTTYRFRVRAINAVGTGGFSTASNAVIPMSTVPDAPTIGSATAGIGSATVTWSAPGSDGGSPITGYLVTPYIGVMPQAATTFNSVLTSQTVTGLTNGASYTFTVAAINVVGVGPASAPSNEVTLPDVPGAPTIGTAAGGNAEATLTWTAPVSDGGSPITGYSVTPYIGASPQAAVVFNSPATSQVITGLANGTTYTFTVAAINAVGTGAASAASNAVTPMTVPDAPIIGIAEPGNAEAVVGWTTPASDGGSPILGYIVTPYIGATPQTPVTFNSPTPLQTVTGLTNGVAYTFRVAAFNIVGTGAQSANSNSVTPVITAAAEGGASHSCAVLPDTTVACWGDNADGQLGDGTTTAQTVPVQVTGLTGVTAIALGQSHTCALLSAGTVSCWGSNQYGQLGDGTLTDRLVPTAVPSLTSVTAISTSHLHTCALLASGGAKCWGYSGHGEVGDGTTVTRRNPTTVSGLSGATAISAGSWHTCARLSTGVVKCWGSNTRGQLGDGTVTQRLAPVSVFGMTTASGVTAAGSTTCAITGGTVKCWGLNHHGQVGDNSVANRVTPVAVLGLSGVTELAGGLYHVCALLSAGTVKCWGYNTFGQLGNNSVTERHWPVSVLGLSGVLSISAGAHHSIARLTTGGVRAWGANTAGQLGDTTTTNRGTPVAVMTLG